MKIVLIVICLIAAIVLAPMLLSILGSLIVFAIYAGGVIICFLAIWGIVNLIIGALSS